MKRCPTCNRTYSDDNFFCLSDGTGLISDEAEMPTIVAQSSFIEQTTQPVRQGASSIFLYVTIGVFLLLGLIGGGILLVWLASSSPRDEASTNTSKSTARNESLTNTSKATAKDGTLTNTSKSNAGNETLTDNSNTEPDSDEELERLNEEKARLQKEKERLEQERQKLASERKKLEETKNEPYGGTENSDAVTALVFDPPSNVRDVPNGRIICSVKKRTRIRIIGITGVYDENGTWYYTDVCGRIGVIHSSQIRF